MNNAKLQFDEGNLKGAVESALAAVKANPTDTAARIFLFELSCFSGDWERAARQLDVIGHQDVNAMIGSKIYTENFEAERARMNLFAHSSLPETLMPLPEYVKDLLKAIDFIRQGNTAEAKNLLDEVEEKRPAAPCKVNGEDFGDFRDYNDSTMCVFEAIVKGSYVWLPTEQITRINFLERKSLRDVFWLQADVELTNGTRGEMFIPSLYANSWKSENDAIRIGREVDWRDAGDDIFVGEGTKLYWMDGNAKSILDIQTIEFSHE